MENHQEELGISDYAISQATLEQVFLHFAKEQEEIEEEMPENYWKLK
jgi:hypothetical protein